MPFIHVNITKKITPEKKQVLAAGIGKIAAELPGKAYEKIMVRIDDGCDIFRGGEPAECVYTQTAMKRSNEFEDQKAYVEKLYDFYKAELDFDVPQCYFGMLELDTWGSRGTLK